MSNFERKAYTREEMNIIVAEHLQVCIEPICKEIGRAIEGLQSRIVELESASNAIITEMKEWKAQDINTLQFEIQEPSKKDKK